MKLSDGGRSGKGEEAEADLRLVEEKMREGGAFSFNLGPPTMKLKMRKKNVRTSEKRTSKSGKKRTKVTPDTAKRVRRNKEIVDLLKTSLPPFPIPRVLIMRTAGTRMTTGTRTVRRRKIHSILLMLSPPKIPWTTLLTALKICMGCRSPETEEMRLTAKPIFSL